MVTQIKLRHAKAHLKSAQAYANLSHAVRLKVGCLLVKDGTPVAIGWNGMPPGFPNECEDKLDDGSLVTKAGCRHAETNALNKLRRSNESSVGAVLFITHSPCLECAIDLVEAKIAGVVFVDQYRSLDGVQHLRKNGIQVFRHDAFRDIFFEYTKNGDSILHPLHDQKLGFVH